MLLTLLIVYNLKILKILLKPFTVLINECFTQGCFPKLAIIPIFKNGDRKLHEDYRPLFLVCNFGKVIEISLKSMQKCEYFEKSIHTFQFGFRTDRSTTNSVCQVIAADTVKGLEEWKHIVLILCMWSYEGF